MNGTRLAILATLSIAISLFLGAIDYETRSIGDLFALQNIPALVIFAGMAFTLLLLLSLGISALRNRLMPASTGRR